jgi:Ni,Fe-hydrogenase I cytochrome b subunit
MHNTSVQTRLRNVIYKLWLTICCMQLCAVTNHYCAHPYLQCCVRSYERCCAALQGFEASDTWLKRLKYRFPHLASKYVLFLYSCIASHCIALISTFAWMPVLKSYALISSCVKRSVRLRRAADRTTYCRLLFSIHVGLFQFMYALTKHQSLPATLLCVVPLQVERAHGHCCCTLKHLTAAAAAAA